jgi:origin recognition complex subunit 3
MIGSPLLRETMLSIKKMPSDKLVQLLDSLADYDLYLPFDLVPYQDELAEIIQSNDSTTPLRSQHDVRNESLRTTVVAQKVLLSKHKATLTEQDKAYSDLNSRFHDDIEKYFTTAFIDPQDLFLSELFIYDLKSPHTEVFQPRPRFAIERSLSSPFDYLGCDCCGPDRAHDGETALASTQPATAILYQLYLESGALINVSDLWSAFNAMVGEEDEEGQSRTM